jgi:hypothetical protein
VAEGSAGSRNYTKCGKRSGSALEHEVGISFDGRARSSIKLLQNHQMQAELASISLFFLPFPGLYCQESASALLNSKDKVVSNRHLDPKLVKGVDETLEKEVRVM